MRADKILAFAAVAMLVVAVASAAVVKAKQAPGVAVGRHHGAFGLGPLVGLNYVGRQLGLTDQQKQQVKDIVKSRRDDIKSLVDQWFAARKALRQAIDSNNGDAIAAAMSQVSTVELKGAQLGAALHTRIVNEVLQPDQRAKAAELETTFEQKADQRRQRIEALLDAL